MSQPVSTTIAVMGIDIGKNSFHVVGLDHAARSCCGRGGHVARWKGD